MRDLTLEITNKCYNRCVHCSTYDKEDAKEHFLNIEDVRMFLNTAKTMNFDRIILSGGEPLLHPNFKKIVSYLKAMGFAVKLYTSGVIDTEKYSELPMLLQDIDVISISQYATSRDIHTWICEDMVRTFSYSNTDHGSPIASYAKSQLFIQTLEHFNIPYEINTVLLPMNVHEIIPLYRKFKNKCTSFNVMRLVLQGRASDHMTNLRTLVDEYSYKEVLDCLDGKEKVKVSSSFGIDKHTNFACDVGRNKFCITSDKYVIPCEVFKDSRRDFKQCMEYATSRDLMDDYLNHWLKEYTKGCDRLEQL